MRDLKQEAKRILNRAKQQLAAGGRIYPTAIVIAEVDVLVAMDQFRSAEEKQAAGLTISEVAKEKKAQAVMMLFDARWKAIQSKEEYHQGDLRKENAPECLVVATKGPGFEPYTVVAKYSRLMDGRPAFDETELQEGGGEFNLIPDWW